MGYKDRFEKAGLTAILGCGFDPGVTSIYTAYAAKHHFDEIQYLDIVDCNAGNHHKAFATNFNPEINIREITQKGLYWEDGRWVETEPLEIHKPLTYPNIGPKESYLLHHEEIESLVKNYPTIKRARFWMTFGQEYLTHLRVIQNIGMDSIKPIMYQGMEIVPLQFLKAVLPTRRTLARTTRAKQASAAAYVVSRTARNTLTTFTTTARTRRPTTKRACRASATQLVCLPALAHACLCSACGRSLACGTLRSLTQILSWKSSTSKDCLARNPRRRPRALTHNAQVMN